MDKMLRVKIVDRGAEQGGYRWVAKTVFGDVVASAPTRAELLARVRYTGYHA